MESKFNNHSNCFHHFVKVQKDLLESFSDGDSVGRPIIQLDDLFTFFDEHFKEFHQKENLRVILAFIQRSLKLWISREDYLKDDIGVHLMDFVEDHREDENDLNIVLQIVYQIMNSIKYFGNNDIPISEKLLRELCTILMTVKCRTLVSCCVACIQLYMTMFPESYEILPTLWSNVKSKLEINLKLGITQDTEIDILIQLIDDFKAISTNFHEEPILINIIQHLLKSDQRRFRKCGYFLLKKVLQYFIENVTTVTANDHKEQIERTWIHYITLLENLEEEQSHLILPSLENLDELIKGKHLKSSWLDILYMRILTHNNNLVLRWSIEFFLKTFLCSDLCEDILKLLLQATNSNLLYNYEGYFLDRDLFNSFLKGNLTNFLTLLPEIDNWKSPPLYVWLENLQRTQLPESLTLEMILKISACVRKLQNCTIRQEAIKMCNELFKEFVKKMSMSEYVMYIETLYNSSDNYMDFEMFFNKKCTLIELTSTSSIFKQRFYDIFTNSAWDNDELLVFLNDIPVEQHGWLKFALFQLELTECNKKDVNNLYKIDLNSLTHCDVHKVINIFENCLLDSPPHDKHELRECHHAAISFCIYQWSDLQYKDEDTLRFIINSEIKHKVVNTFASKILDKFDKAIDLRFIDELLKYNSKPVLDSVSRYLINVYDNDVVLKYAVNIFEKYNYISTAFAKVNLLKRCTDELFKELATKGENRIEQAFCFNHFGKQITRLRSISLQQTKTFSNEEFILDILKYHADLTKKKPRYFENSNEHRTKLRIAICVFRALGLKATTNVDVLDQIWDILLNENNQLNIIYMYEYILGTNEFREELIRNKLKEVQSLTSSQQVSIISVVYLYMRRRSSDIETKKAVFTNLMALTMGANFQTRLFAQMSLYKLLSDTNLFSTLAGKHQLVTSIEYAAGTKLNEYLNDIRIQIHYFQEKFDIMQLILYVTNTPFDELFELFDLDNFRDPLLVDDVKQVKLCRETFMKKFKVPFVEDTVSKSSINDQIQRKMNPVNDLTEPHNLIVYPKEEKPAEMFVIASLIDKLPNLGGIARTCEVLGIQNLVMDSKMHTTKNDFKNLSMTAENTLNIFEVKPKDLTEFLINKKIEGYVVVGAEQTSNSQNFSNFKFPQKCILLLGHEKDGIPAPLLGLLDYAVEIPQFGQIRSLNVHVTGALFMWEFCKQHLVQKE